MADQQPPQGQQFQPPPMQGGPDYMGNPMHSPMQMPIQGGPMDPMMGSPQAMSALPAGSHMNDPNMYGQQYGGMPPMGMPGNPSTLKFLLERQNLMKKRA